jgi:hypothetical protein
LRPFSISSGIPMNEFILHVLLIWALLSLTLILTYEKFVVEPHMEHNMYTGKGRSYNKKKARATHIRLVMLSGLLAFAGLYLLSFFS